MQPQITIEQPGYIYVIVYNRSNSASYVYFDDLKVVQTHSTIVAASDYYPFGLVMDGRQVTDVPYRYGYQGQYAEKDNTTGWNEFDLRMYDARFGRWISPDPYGQFASPYLAMGNEPNSSIDPDGGFNLGATAVGALGGFAIGATIGLGADLINDGKIDDGYWWKGGAIGGLIGGVAGASAGDIGGEAFDNGFQKFRAEVKFALQGEKYGVYNSIKIRRGELFFGAGDKIATSVKELPWKDLYSGYPSRVILPRKAILNGLNRRSRYIVEGKWGARGYVIITNSSGTPARPYSIRSSGDGGLAETLGTYKEPYVNFKAELPKGSSGVIVTLSPTFWEDGGVPDINTVFDNWATLNELIPLKVKSIHTKFTGGRLFR